KMKTSVRDYKNSSNLKELLNFDFVKDEVLTTPEEISARRETLYMATVLGNSYNRKAKIECITSAGTELLEGRIWAITNFKIILKGGLNIPINSIAKVDII
ncbi:MAG TPA: hypothetical protein VEA37_08635, partial [Flavobacterium sp.]|nr:hypothetical protein [Flavobacterium sp.]